MENATDPRAQFGLDAIGPALDADAVVSRTYHRRPGHGLEGLTNINLFMCLVSQPTG